MRKEDVIKSVYQIAMLADPSDEVLEILLPLNYDRIFELMLIMRQAKNIKTPRNFLLRAIQEHWTPETTPKAVNRKAQSKVHRISEIFYLQQGYSKEDAERLARDDASKY